jgi:hypothetical protein
MKFSYGLIAATTLLFCSCNSEPPQRGDALSIDNPSEEDYFIVIDEDTLPLPANTYIEGFKPICTGEENITYESGHNPGVHRYQVLDSTGKQIFDTTFLSRYRHLLINPTRSMYVEWTVFYGDSIDHDQYDTIVFDSMNYIGEFKTYNGFAIQNESMKDVVCERALAVSKESWHPVDNVMEQIMPEQSLEVYFYRITDFLIAYNETYNLTPAEEAEVELHNLLIHFYNNTVENWTHPFRNGEVEALGRHITADQLPEAVDLIKVNGDFFEKHDAAGVKRMNELFEVAKTKTERVNPIFTPLNIVRYDYDSQGKPYISELIEYFPIGDCITTDYDAPAQ